VRLVLYQYFVFVRLILLYQLAAYSNDSLIVSSSRFDLPSNQSSLTVSCNIDSSQIFLDTNFVGVNIFSRYNILESLDLL
jgi:hypothetical protein